MKNIAVLGSSGSIGKNTLKVIRSLPDEFKVVALSVNSDIASLKKQIKEFHPKFACVQDERAARELKADIGGSVKVLCGQEGLQEIAQDKSVQQVMVAITGSAALPSLIAAIKSAKEIALANKEALVMAGDLVMRLCARHKVLLRPVDSEQSAIWQALAGESTACIRRVYLTASGGPLWNLPVSKFKQVGVEKVLAHPRWKMGKKITVDSATLMNKGLELLEAMFLFGLPLEKIKILIHPEALIHSMVEFCDGVTIAQLSATDMRIPIQYALSYPKRLKNSLVGIDFYRLGKLHFARPDLKKFPCLDLAQQAARGLGTLPAVMNAANEVSVGRFLAHKIKFTKIAEIVEKVMRHHKLITNPSLKQIMYADAWARIEAKS